MKPRKRARTLYAISALTFLVAFGLALYAVWAGSVLGLALVVMFSLGAVWAYGVAENWRALE